MTKHWWGPWAAALIGVVATVDIGARRPLAGGMAEPTAAGLPFRLLAGYLVVVEGRIGKLDGLNLVIDTGTTRTVVDADVARQLGGAAARLPIQVFGREVGADAVVVQSLSFGPVHATNLLALSADLRSHEARFGLRLDALIGLDVLTDRCFAIDYAAKLISFSCAAGSRGRASFDPDAPYPLVEAVIDNRRYRLFVDTGSEAVVLFESALPSAKTTRVETEVSGAHLAGTVRLKRFTARRFTVGGHPIGTAPVFIMGDTGPPDGYDGVLGTRWLPATRVHFDFPRGVLTWQ